MPGLLLVSLVRANDSGETGALLADFRRLNVALSRAKAKMVVVGSARTLYHCHYDLQPNLHVQLVGRKRVLVFAPSEWPNVYPYPAAHPMESYSMVDVESPDLDRFPALARAHGLECDLSPGDTLWLPAYTWHHVRQLDEGSPNLSLNCWVGMNAVAVRLPSTALASPPALPPSPWTPWPPCWPPKETSTLVRSPAEACVLRLVASSTSLLALLVYMSAGEPLLAVQC